MLGAALLGKYGPAPLVDGVDLGLAGGNDLPVCPIKVARDLGGHLLGALLLARMPVGIDALLDQGRRGCLQLAVRGEVEEEKHVVELADAVLLVVAVGLDHQVHRLAFPACVGEQGHGAIRLPLA